MGATAGAMRTTARHFSCRIGWAGITNSFLGSNANQMSNCIIRAARAGDERGAYYVCLKTGDHGKDGEAFYREDPDALGRIYVGPYLAFEPELSLILEDEEGICGYAFGAFDSRKFYAQYEDEWRIDYCVHVLETKGDHNT